MADKNRGTFGNFFKNAFSNFLNKEVKSVPAVGLLTESPRDEINKAVEPKFLYKPPFGYPRNVNLYELRRLATTPYVDLVISAIVDTVVSTDWDIVVSEKEDDEKLQKEVEHVEAFFLNPNTNNESFENILRKVVRDILELDSGVLIKQFNLKGEMVGIVAKDGATFLKNPDIYGMYTDREELLLGMGINMRPEEELDNIQGAGNFMLSYAQAREKAAYFQYGWVVGIQPIPFGKREVVWFERDVRTDDFYGRSKLVVLSKVVQMLLYGIDQNLEYYTNNNMVNGILGLEGAPQDEVKAFQEIWMQNLLKQDEAGNWRRQAHKIPVVSKKPTFVPINYSNAEFQMLEQQQWFSKFVWNLYGATPSELGFTEDAKGMANQVVQSSSFRRRAINPLLRLIEYKLNNEVINEFGYEGIEFQFNKFDVEEEQRKANLYEVQLRTFKTPNEIRRMEGLEEVEGGDELRPMQSANSFNINTGQNSENDKEDSEDPKEPDKEKTKEENLEDIDKEEKALNTTSSTVLFPKNGEELLLYLKKTLKENERKIISTLIKENGEDQLKNTKSISDLIDYLKSILDFGNIKPLSDAVIKNLFQKGWDKAEKKLQINVLVNAEALEFLKKHTFENIKGMTNEIANDLRAEMERGFINGESITKIKDRIKSVFDVAENRAEMIARTETNRAENQGELLAMKKSGKEMTKTWLATEDERECTICNRLDGQTVDINKKYKDPQTGEEFECAPSHVNCRCSQIFNYKDE